MARCNYCTYQSLMKRGEVILKPAPKPGFDSGVDAFIKYPNGDTVWIAWLAKVPSHCVC